MIDTEPGWRSEEEPTAPDAVPPHEAIEAAAKAMVHLRWPEDEPITIEDREVAEAALAAAYPAIREAIAQEIEAAGRTEVKWLSCNRQDDLDTGRLIGTEDAYKAAIRIVRGGDR